MACDPLQLKANIQEQQEELEALQAIYEEEFITEDEPINLSNLPLRFHLVLPIEIPGEGITLNAWDNLGDTNELQMIGNFTLQHLPPITLSFMLPSSYPSHSPPEFKISAEWINKEQLSKACSELDLLCEANTGMQVLFVLCNWIQCDYMDTIISSNREINLHRITEIENTKFQEPRAIPQCKNLQDTVLSLLQYSKRETITQFQLYSHTCDLCFEEKPGKQFTLLSCCGKGFCGECIMDMCQNLVKSGSIELLKCPNCETEFHPNFLKKYLPQEQMERWERLVLQKTLDTMSDVRYCPRCETVVIVDEDNFAQCSHCTYAFCSNCLGNYHQNSSCDEIAVLMKQARQSKDSENQMKSIRMINKRARRCPSCSIYIEKSHGCNKMTCSHCGKFFCYSCGVAVTGYDHFNTSGGRGGCKVFDEVTDDMLDFYAQMQNLGGWEGEQMDYAALRAERSKRCPYCGQVNIKQGRNNDVCCFNCRKHYCFLCGEKIKGTLHFSTSQCFQHS